MEIRRSNLALAWILCLLTCSCVSAPDSYPPPAQFVMPSGPEPPAAMPDAFRPLINMADLDWKSHVLADVLDGPDSEEWRWCRPSPRFRITPNEIQGAQFYMRFIVVADILRKSGAVTVAISINGHELDRPRYVEDGEHEYTRAVPDGWLVANQPVTIALDVTPPLVTASGDKLGILLHSIGFKK